MIDKYDFHKTKYGNELLIDLIPLECLEKYIFKGNPHTLSYFDITLITSGSGHFLLDNVSIELFPGKVIFSSPGQVRYWDLENMPEGLVLIFEESFLTSFLNDVHFIDHLKYFFTYTTPAEITLLNEDRHFLTQLFQNIRNEIDFFDKNDTHILKALLYQALVWLNRKYSNTYPDSAINELNRHIVSFKKLVEIHFATHHEISFYAEKLNITQGHLNDLSKRHLGVNAKQYVQNKLLTEARKLVAYSNLTISEIALQLKFDDTSYFIRKFKKNTGTTPLSYRTKNP